jgi:hypothetical protein
MAGGDVENVPSSHFDHATVAHCSRCAARDRDTNVLDFAAFLVQRLADVLGPLPARVVDGATERHPGDVDHLKPTFLERSCFVGVSKRFRIVSYTAHLHRHWLQECIPALIASCRMLRRAEKSSIRQDAALSLG